MEIPNNYFSHNSEQFTSDYGSTSKYTTIEEEQRLQAKEEKQLTTKKWKTSKKQE